MARVLISFLGTSNPTITENNYRKYKCAKYKFDNGQEFESPFIAAALKKRYDIEKLILVGTPKSMWEEVYHAFTEKTDDIYFELGAFCETATSKTPLESFPHKQELENALGNGSKVVLVQYGLNNEEIKYNSEKVLSIEKLLESGDELYLDITHSFRSLPLLLMNSLLFMKSASLKKIQIKSISYGMLDITREIGYTPVVELNSILELNDWITGASELRTFGNSYKVAYLMKKTGSQYDAMVARILTDLSDAMNLNYVSEIKKKLDEVRRIRCNEMSPFAQFLVEPSIKDFIRNFDTAPGQRFASQFQFQLAKYQFNQKHYAAAALCLVEAMISLVVECEGLNNNPKKRDLAKDIISGNSLDNNMIQRYSEFFKKYLRVKRNIEENDLTDRSNQIIKEYCDKFDQLRKRRNAVAHTIPNNTSLQDVIDDLSKALDFVSPIVFFDQR